MIRANVRHVNCKGRALKDRGGIMRTIVLSMGVLAFIAGWAVKPVTTYSIIARDPETGQFGVAVQSHWFSVGATVPWVVAGVGVVATQSLTEVSYGPLGIELMRSGKTAQEAMKALVSIDANPQWRQVGMIDANGNRAVHTGNRCIREAGHVVGDNFICMANLMEKDTVWRAMANAFRNTGGELADRLLAALDAAQDEGGDIRGRQSAALIVVTGEPTGKSYEDRLIDLRVDDNENPLRELRRLLTISRAYKYMNQGDERLAAQDEAGALTAYGKAMELAPQITEIQFWVAVTLFTNGQEEEALDNFKKVFVKDPSWMEVVRRLPFADLLENENGEVARILGVATQ
jgi:uncharacterized Ntn-hydrolase superfamily protein